MKRKNSDIHTENRSGIKKKTGCIMTAVILVLGICVIYLGTTVWNMSKAIKKQAEDAKITTSMVTDSLSTVSELTTMRLNYHGALRYEEEGIKFLTQKSFVMFYEAEVKAGVDLSKTDVVVEDRVIHVTLPQAEILTFTILPDSIEFYDESMALFNWESKQDAVNALQKAEEDASEKINSSELLEEACLEAEKLVRKTVELITKDNRNPEDVYQIIIERAVQEDY